MFRQRLDARLFKRMAKLPIKSVTMTTVSMTRTGLITLEDMENNYELKPRTKIVLPQNCVHSRIKSFHDEHRAGIVRSRSDSSHFKYSSDKTKITSFQDDLDLFFDNLRLDKFVNTYAHTQFLPKLTEAEQALVEKKDLDFSKTFFPLSPGEVLSAEWRRSLSKSDKQFVMCDCHRKTFVVNRRPPQNILDSKISRSLSPGSPGFYPRPQLTKHESRDKN